MPIPAAIGMMAAPVIQAGLDFALGGYNRQNQLEQQQKLTDQQVAAQKELGEFNQAQALEMWKATNYDAQVAQMKKAGLNVGLMYKGAGAGGTTQGGTAGSVAGGQAAQAPPLQANLGMGLQLAMQQAQIENIKAQTEKTKVDTAKTAGVDTEAVSANIANTIQATNNARLTAEYQKYENELKAIETNIAKETEFEIIRQASFTTGKLIGEAQQALAKGEIDEKTKDTLIEQIKTNALEQTLRIAAQKAGIILTQEQTKNIPALREIKWTEIDQAEKERFVKEKLMGLAKEQTEFNTSTAAQIRQLTSIITDALHAIK